MAELIIAFSLVGLILFLATQTLTLLAADHRTADNLTLARQQARNILEQVSLLDPRDTQSTALLIKALEAEVAARLPGGQLEVLLESKATDDDPPGLLRLQVIVRMQDRLSLRRAPVVTLTTWVASSPPTSTSTTKGDNDQEPSS